MKRNGKACILSVVLCAAIAASGTTTVLAAEGTESAAEYTLKVIEPTVPDELLLPTSMEHPALYDEIPAVLGVEREPDDLVLPESMADPALYSEVPSVLGTETETVKQSKTLSERFEAFWCAVRRWRNDLFQPLQTEK